jgi:dihydrofolate synthase/folylpolyglutamate synthase
MGMLSTKEHDEVFKALLRPNDLLYIVPVPDHSSAKPEELAQLANQICPLKSCQTYTNLQSALNAAFALPELNYFDFDNFTDKAPKDLVVLCGSLYLIGHFLGIKDFNESSN